MDMQLFLCITGTTLLVTSVLLCWFMHDRPWLWLGMLIVGEIVALSGAIPVLSKLPC